MFRTLHQQPRWIALFASMGYLLWCVLPYLYVTEPLWIPSLTNTTESVGSKLSVVTDTRIVEKDATERAILNGTNINIAPQIEGIDFNQSRSALVGSSSPWNPLKSYKNPCWMEKLPADYATQYEQTPFYRYGHRQVSTLRYVYDARLRAEARPWRLRCLPYLLLAGVTKSGTTDLYDALSIHPDIHQPWVKEPMYWNRRRPKQGVTVKNDWEIRHWTFDNYVSEFDHAAHQISQSTTEDGQTHPGITIDGSSYLFWEDNAWRSDPRNKGLAEPAHVTPDAVHTLLPHAKVVVLMRNPVSRALSAYQMYNSERTTSKRLSFAPSAFHKHVSYGIRRYERCFRDQGVRACAYNVTLQRQLHPVSLQAGFYSVYLREWLRAYGRDQVHVVRSEDYYKKRLQSVRGVWDFLGLRDVPGLHSKVTMKPVSFKRKYPAMLPDTKRLLQDFYRPFNQELAEMLGREMWT